MSVRIKHLDSHWTEFINPLNAELNPICHLLALVGARHIVHVSRISVKGNVSADRIHVERSMIYYDK